MAIGKRLPDLMLVWSPLDDSRPNTPDSFWWAYLKSGKLAIVPPDATKVKDFCSLSAAITSLHSFYEGEYAIYHVPEEVLKASSWFVDLSSKRRVSDDPALKATSKNKPTKKGK